MKARHHHAPLTSNLEGDCRFAVIQVGDGAGTIEPHFLRGFCPKVICWNHSGWRLIARGLKPNPALTQPTPRGDAREFLQPGGFRKCSRWNVGPKDVATPS